MKTAGWKFNYWEQKGVPLRLELGPRDYDEKKAMVKRRDTFKGTVIAWDDLLTQIPTMLETVQADMLAKARMERDSRIRYLRLVLQIGVISEYLTE